MVTGLIAKEDILNYKIVHAVDHHNEELQEKLVNAVRLGNTFKTKVTITFMTADGPKKVETTIWNATEEYIELKGGILIATKSLLSIEY
jgi:HKD family nuclease